MLKSFKLSKLGREALAHSNYTTAESYFRKALALYPRSDEAQTGLAQALGGQGRSDEASVACGSAYTDADALNTYSTFPTDITALARHGLIAEEAGQHREAVKAYNMARQWLGTKLTVPLLTVPLTEADPKGPPPHLGAMLRIVQGVALAESKDQDRKDRSGEALQTFQEAAQQEPNDARVQYYLGYGLQKAGQFAAAQAAYARAARLDTAGTVRAAAEEGARAAQARRR